MSDREARGSFGLGMIFGAVFITLLTKLPSSYMSQAQAAIEECESALPRNERCIITAVPAGKGGE
jgi:hypothetical protein